MRVMIVTHRFPPDGIAGVERITQTLAAELTQRDDQVCIVSFRPQSTYASSPIRQVLSDGTLVYRFLGISPPRTAFLLYHADQELHFSNILLKFAPDVVHFMHLMDISPRFVEIAHHHHAAVVLSLQDYYVACPHVTLRKPNGELCSGPNGGLECAQTCFAAEGENALLRWGTRNLYYRRILQMAERLIAPSQYVTDYFTRYGVDASRLHIIHNGVSIPRAESVNDHRTPQQRGQLNIAYLGSVVPHKGAHVILEGLRLARLPKADLILIGQTPEVEYTQGLRDMADQIPGLSLRMYGAYEPSMLTWLLHDVDCVITPSVWPETFAIVTREALTRGIPLIVSRLGALPEAITEGENGFTFDPANPKELAVILRRMAGDEALVQRLRAGAAATLALTVEQHAEAVRSVYARAVEDLKTNPAATPSKLDEFHFLHEALIHLGFSPSSKLPTLSHLRCSPSMDKECASYAQ